MTIWALLVKLAKNHLVFEGDPILFRSQVLLQLN